MFVEYNNGGLINCLGDKRNVDPSGTFKRNTSEKRYYLIKVFKRWVVFYSSLKDELYFVFTKGQEGGNKKGYVSVSSP